MLILCGIPYPSLADPFVKLKMSYYNTRSPQGGEQWYHAQATRNIAQILGRGWRHHDDWCLGVLLDHRYLWTNSAVVKE